MILAIDQGTSGTTCLVFDRDWRLAGRAYGEIGASFPRPGWVEQDPEEIWRTTVAVANAALADAGVAGRELDAIGISNQRETVVAWDRQTGQALQPAIVWQDRRTAERCAELRAGGAESLVRERTGLVIDPYFSATKIAWIAGRLGEAENAVYGTIDAWLVFRLTGAHACDHSNASRTSLYDIHELAWDERLCELFGVDSGALPEVQASASAYGETDVFGGSVPVLAAAGDQQAALFGQGCFAPGDAKCTYGTGSFLLLNTGRPAPPPAPGLVTTLAASIEPLGGEAAEPDYALEASVFVSGAAIQWLRDGLGLIESAAETEALARSVESTDGVHFVPALTGLGSPWWDPDARGQITGLTRGTGRAHLVRATLEAIAYQTVDAVRAAEQAAGTSLEALHVDGGAVENSWLMQFQADVLGVPVVVAPIAETTALGAARLAGVVAGTWSAERSEREVGTRRFDPAIAPGARDELLAGWHAALARASEVAAAAGAITPK